MTGRRRQRQLAKLKLKLWISVVVVGFVAAVALAILPYWQNYSLAKKQNAVVARYDRTAKKQSNSSYLAKFYKQKSVSKKVDLFKLGQSSKGSSNSIDAAKAVLKPIATLSIPKINEVLPVYGSANDPEALDNGAALVDGSGDLLGGKGKNPGLASHTGKSIGRLFTDLPRLKKKDKFFVRVNGEIHAYAVDRIRTVNPDNVSALRTNPTQDYITLITCTANDNNAHRLLVRGHRVPYVPQDGKVESGGLTPLGQLILVASSLIGGLLIIAVLVVILIRHYQNRKKWTFFEQK